MLKPDLLYPLTLLVAISSGLGAFAVDEARAEVKVTTKTSYYNVSGKTGKTLSENMLREGKKNISLSHAIAATQYNYDFGSPKIAVKKGKCYVEDVDVFVNIQYIFPKWENQQGASSALKSKWASFYRELQNHEKYHGEVAIKGARALEKQIKTFSGRTAAGCRDMGTFASFKLSNIIRKIRSEQRAFDRIEYLNSSKISKLQMSLYKAP